MDGQTRSVASRIVGGYLDSMTHGVVALAEPTSQTNVVVFCSGTLIAPNLVLTARHCIADIGDGSSESVDCKTSQFGAVRDPRSLYVSTEATPQTSKGALYGVSQILQAPGSSNVCGFDVALLILNKNVPASAATPIDPALGTTTTATEDFSAVGFGLQDPNDSKGKTAGTRMRFDGSQVYCVGSSCPGAAGTAADEFVGASPVCSGDSGGPALNAAGQVLGVTSRGDAECTYALYSNVASWADFIRGTAKTAAMMAGYTAPAWASSIDSTPLGTAGGSNANAASTGGSAGSAGSSSSSNTAGGGASDVGTGTAGADPTPPVGVTPVIDPLGQACQSKDDCQGTYQCYSPSSTPPGMCVPPCATSSSHCPTDYACNTDLKVCVPTPPVVHRAQASASCSLSAQPQNRSGGAALVQILVLGCAWLGRRRRSGS